MLGSTIQTCSERSRKSGRVRNEGSWWSELHLDWMAKSWRSWSWPLWREGFSPFVLLYINDLAMIVWSDETFCCISMYVIYLYIEWWWSGQADHAICSDRGSYLQHILPIRHKNKRDPSQLLTVLTLAAKIVYSCPQTAEKVWLANPPCTPALGLWSRLITAAHLSHLAGNVPWGMY